MNKNNLSLDQGQTVVVFGEPLVGVETNLDHALLGEPQQVVEVVLTECYRKQQELRTFSNRGK